MGARGKESERPSAKCVAVGLWTGLFLSGLILLSGCVPMAEVIQGRVTAVEPRGGVIRVQNELAPDAPPIAIDISRADVGAAPAVGDEVRVAYHSEGGVNRALRVMNLTRDRERTGSGH